MSFEWIGYWWVQCLIGILIYVLIFFIVKCFGVRTKKTREKKEVNELIIIALIISTPVFFLSNFLFQSKLSGYIEMKDFSNVPNYLVFLATAISAYYIYRTLNNQRQANQLAAFENKFFKFIDYHRENVDQLRYRDPQFNGEKYRVGNEVFTTIYYEIKNLVKEFLENGKFIWNELSLDQKAEIIGFIYDCIFYGTGEDGIKILKTRHERNSKFFDYIYFENKSAKYSSLFKDQKFYSGHVRRLGHYFRNLFQAVQYVDKQKFLTPNEKYEYIKILRAQMSVYEQATLFYTSLSHLGESWEWENYRRLNFVEADKKSIFNKLFITKYDLIRNTINNDGKIIVKIHKNRQEADVEISIKDFYPLINFEGEEECSVSGILPFKNQEIKICRFCFNDKYVGYENDDANNRVRQWFEKASQTERDKFKCAESKCFGMKIKDEYK